MFLFQKSFMLSTAADITEYPEEEEEEQVCRLFTSRDVHTLASSGVLTPRPSLHSYRNMSKWVWTISSKRDEFLYQS